MQGFREFKAIWDPDGKMNPGKVVDPYPITSNLRVGPSFQPPRLKTEFTFRNDDLSFARATQRCVGVGACRRRSSDKGVMCPSYMVTNEERHSTRGRARLLFEMVHDGAIDGSWRSDAVEEALDLCLSCKGCKRDCPVQVDMATYKAEFRSHYYDGRIRPRAAYSMGLIYEWAKLADHTPAFANAILHAPILGEVGKWVGGIASQRQLPKFAHTSFRQWFNSRNKRRAPQRVLLWPDTFNTYFRPQTAIAATELLEWLGYEVDIPSRPLCCGRPLYDWGMLGRARQRWRETLDTLAHAIRDGTPLVVLEPACASAFRDELPALFAGDERAERLAQQARLFTDFIMVQPLPSPAKRANALVQIHCHQHAVFDPNAEEELLKRAGYDAHVMASGCCGMAGAFGFETAKYDLSIQAAERVMAPSVRKAAPDTLILANGFSCREQIEQTTSRQTLHIAEALHHHFIEPRSS